MNKDELEILRHSAAHVMAMAVQQKYPKAEFAIGPAIENGFYYDIDLAEKISPEDFGEIESAMREIIKADLPLKREELSIAEAKKLFAKHKYKLEIIEDLARKGESKASIYRMGDFVDLCRGPHVESTGKLKPDAFKLTSVAGAYWRGDSKNKQLQRIYGTAWASKKELDGYLHMLEEAEKRDHRKIGPALELIYFDPKSPGVPYWLPKGLVVYKELYRFWADYHEEHGYLEFRSPLLNRKELFETSGHWDHYRDDMWVIKEDENNVYAMKPMNCPNSIVVYGTKTRSHADLPLRLNDADMLYRHESTGSLNGLFRTFEFNQDDAHIFVAPEQLADEFDRLFGIVRDFYGMFGLSFKLNLSTRPDSFLGEIETWDKAEKLLEDALVRRFGRENFAIKEKDGAFYGPKIDIHMKDVLGREWQMGTIQLDFQLPARFGCSYIDRDGQKKTPILIHRAIYGSLGRFIGILIEHFAGKFPIWLSPVHAVIIPISDAHQTYADKVYDSLVSADIHTATRGLRVEKSYSSESMQKRIREAQVMQVPYMLVLGDKEAEAETVSIRTRDGKQRNGVALADFVAELREKILSKSLEL
ncbi:MAG: threonine--tRNA ligase [Rickettsiales bacterium]|jgi:threonyl-tRNA synthetase|nr:threonine--tRNA ligase [Rickettsiales bacterium]